MGLDMSSRELFLTQCSATGCHHSPQPPWLTEREARQLPFPYPDLSGTLFWVPWWTPGPKE